MVLRTHTNYMVRLTDKQGNITHHEFFVGSIAQARDYARRYAIDHGVMWPVGHSGFTHGFELFQKVNPT
jgi:hypothetical protein